MSLSLKIIHDGEHPADFNMAADCLLLDRAMRSDEITVRFYGWSPWAVSLGCMQREVHLDLDALSRNTVDWVRRPTGGRAILHANDITYSCVFPLRLSMMGSTINETYALLSRCLMSGLSIAGIACVAQDASAVAEFAATKRDLKLSCFLAPNRNEIMVSGKKLAGSAQKRTANGCLQHGSLPIDGTFRRLPDFLALSQDERERQKALFEKKCVCLDEVKHGLEKDDIIDCLIGGFSEVLGIRAENKNWEKEELQEIERRAEDVTKG